MTFSIKTIIKTITSVFTLLVMTAFTAQVNADEYHHIDQLARKVQRQTRQLGNELRHYRHAPEYAHLVEDTNELSRLAKHIHDVTHFEGNLVHLQSDLDGLDRNFHHLEEVFDRVEHNAAFGHGHVHGNTKHVKRLLKSIEDSIHHISTDVQTLRRPVVFHRPVYTAPRPVYRPVYQPYGGHGGHGHSRSNDFHNNRGVIGFSIGGGSSRIQIRF